MAKKTSTATQREWVRTGETLRTIRKIKGWDLGPFATKIGISYSYLSNIEAGRKRLTPQLLARVATVLDVPQMAITHPGDSEDVA
jgi:plasmid maintenance system antidote protein VapI